MGTLRLGSSVVVPSVTVNGGSQPVIDPLSITPTTSQQTITAPSGTDGYSPITVDAVTSSIDANITSSNIKSGVTILGVNGSVVELDGEQINITPTTSQQVITPTSPKNAITQATVSAVTSSIDANITAENIKKDVEILGITGTYEGGGSATLITKTITANGIYDAADDSADGYSQVTVNVPTSGNTDILKSVVADGKTQLSGTPTPSNPVDIICNNGKLGFVSPAYGYTQLEYLESSGSQYLDLNRVPNNNDIIEQKFKKNGTNTATCAWYGSMPSSQTIIPRIGIGSYSNQSVVTMFAGTNYTGMIGAADTNVHTLRFQATGRQELTYTLDGITDVIDASTSATPPNFYEPAVELTSYLFARHGTSGVQTYDNEGTRIYYHKEYLANGTLAMDLVPAKRNSDGVLGMYDKVSGSFFTNLGTGTFIAGPIVIGINGLSPNLLNSEHSNITLGYWLKNSDGTPEASSANFYTNAYMPVKPDTSYVCYGRKKSDNTLSRYNRIAWYDSSKQWIRNSTYTVDTIGTDTSPSNAAFARFHCNPTGATVDYSLIDSFNWTFREGSTEQDYIPYGQLTETITDFDGNKAVIENLLSIDSNFTDTQNVVDGKVVSKTRILVLKGTENWSSYNQYNLSTFTCSDFDKDGLPSSTKFNVLCNYYQSTTNGVLPEDGQIMFESSSGGLSTATVKIHNDSFTDPTDFKAWLAQKYNDGNPVIIVAPRNSSGSVTYLISPQILVHTPISTTGYLDNLVVNTIVYDSPIHYVEKRLVKVNNVNLLTNTSPSGTSVPTAPIDLKNVNSIDDYVFEDAHWKNSLILPRVAFINSEDLRGIPGEKACYRAFALSNVLKTGLNYVQAITGNYACQMAFYNCTSLIDIGLDRLVTIGSGTGSCASMFYGNTSLEKADFKMLSSISGHLACQYMFQSCTNLKEIIYQSYINTSSTSSNIFSNMLSGVTGCVVHFPIASSNMSSWSDVVAGFGGTNTTVLFDIVRTCTVGGNSYIRSPLDSVGDAIAFKLNQSPNTIGYSIGEPNSGGYLYTTPECTTTLGYISSVS